MLMRRRSAFVKCILLAAVLSSWSSVVHEVECRRFEKCTTREGRQGVCVARRYCREANKTSSRDSTNNLVKCDGSGDTFCCPVPSPRSAPPINIPTSVETKRPTMGDETRRPAKDYDYNRPAESVRDYENDRRRDGQVNKDYDGPNRRDRRPEGPTKDYEPHKSDRRPEGPPSVYEPHKPNRRHEGPSTDYEPHRPDERRDGPSKDYERPSSYPSSVEDREKFPAAANNGGRTRPDNDDRQTRPQRPVVDPDGYGDPEKAIMFPGSYENSRAHPTVPACGVKPYDLFIAGGEESRQHEWPWMTAIFKRSQGPRPNTFLCGGTLINTRYVLSAAHCMVYNYVVQPASSFVVRLGSHYLNTGDDYTVSTVVVHQNHSGSDLFNDIALLRLASEVYITDKIAPICLPFEEDMVTESFVGRMAKVSGWGTSSYSLTGASNVLQHVAVPIVPNEECVAAYSRVREAAFLAMGSEHIICAGLREGGKDACLGDSGGPLMLKDEDDRWVIVGIVSLGFKCAEPGFFGVYTRVTHYLTWIYSNMKK